jgi:hypothetical protein
MLARENTNIYRLGELPSTEIQVGPTRAIVEPCQMAGNKGKIRSAVGLLQCSCPHMMVPRRVGIETSRDLGCPERLAQGSRSHGEPTSLGSAGGGWNGGRPRCGRQTPGSILVSQCFTLSNRCRRFVGVLEDSQNNSG